MATFQLVLDYDGQQREEHFADDRVATTRALDLQHDPLCFSATLYRYDPDTYPPLMIAHWER